MPFDFGKYKRVNIIKKYIKECVKDIEIKIKHDENNQRELKIINEWLNESLERNYMFTYLEDEIKNGNYNLLHNNNKEYNFGIEEIEIAVPCDWSCIEDKILRNFVKLDKPYIAYSLRRDKEENTLAMAETNDLALSFNAYSENNVFDMNELSNYKFPSMLEYRDIKKREAEQKEKEVDITQIKEIKELYEQLKKKFEG